MHSVPMQGGMPMAMPQTMYMAPGQQPMYMQAPAYGIPPGETHPYMPVTCAAYCLKV